MLVYPNCSTLYHSYYIYKTHIESRYNFQIVLPSNKDKIISDPDKFPISQIDMYESAQVKNKKVCHLGHADHFSSSDHLCSVFELQPFSAFVFSPSFAV